jgi:hypothetical protein
LEILEGRRLLATTLTVGPNVNLGHISGSQSEPTIAIDPTNPLHMFATTNNNNGSAGDIAYVSTDGGKNWTARAIADGSADSLPVACCDGQAVFDKFGNLFWSYLTDEGGGQQHRPVLTLSTDGGNTFTVLDKVDDPSSDQPSVAAGGGSVWMTYHDGNGRIAAVGAKVSGKGSVGSFGSPEEAPSSDGDNFGGIAVGPNGQVMVVYQSAGSGEGPDKIWANVDADGLGSGGFGAQITITDTNVGGFRHIPAQSQRSVDAEGNIAYDLSNGPHRGRVYLVYTDAPSASSDDLNIFLRHSDDNGTTWSAPLRVNDDTGTNSQFFSSIAVDAVTGNVALSWYDCRNDPGSGAGDTDGKPNDDVEVFATVSTDGGTSVLPNVQVAAGPSTTTSNHNGGNDFGDYMYVAFHNNVFFPVWVDNSSTLSGNSDKPAFDIATASVTVGGGGGGGGSVPVATADAYTVDVGKRLKVSAAQGVLANDSDPNNFRMTAVLQSTVSNGTLTLRTNGSFTYRPDSGFTGTDSFTYVAHDKNGNSPPATVTITVEPDAVLTATSVDAVFLEGVARRVVVATFTDADPNGQVSDFTATIDWNDGTTSAGRITRDPNGGFDVSGRHAFPDENSTPFDITVSIQDVGGSSAPVTSTVTVDDAPLHGRGRTVIPHSNTPFTGVVATFTDPNRFATVDDFQVSIDWGDGNVSDGIIVPLGNGTFNIKGSNTYAVSGRQTITITITDVGGESLTVLASALVDGVSIVS